MATSTPLLFQPDKVDHASRIHSWIRQLDPAATGTQRHDSPASTPDLTLKRKRASSPSTCTMSTRSGSPPKRPRYERRTSTQLPSTEIMSITSPFPLNSRNTFSAPPSKAGSRNASRTRSPARAVADLANANPATILKPSEHLPPLPPQVQCVMRQLEDGLEEGWIPVALKDQIEQDVDFGNSKFKKTAWGRPESGEDWQYTLKKLKKIWQMAEACSSGGKDENAWCMDVHVPLMKLALRLEGQDKLLIQSVQTQVIDPEYLSSVRDASGNFRAIDRKADYTLYYRHTDLTSRDTEVSSLSHLCDAFSSKTAVFSCIEIKPPGGDHTDADHQISVWMSASLRKKIKLARLAGLTIAEKGCLVEPCFVIVGHQIDVYLAYLAEETDTVYIAGPEKGELDGCETSSMSGMFKALRLWRNVVRYGIDEKETGFWGGFMGELLRKLARTATDAGEI